MLGNVFKGRGGGGGCNSKHTSTQLTHRRSHRTATSHARATGVASHRDRKRAAEGSGSSIYRGEGEETYEGRGREKVDRELVHDQHERGARHVPRNGDIEAFKLIALSFVLAAVDKFGPKARGKSNAFCHRVAAKNGGGDAALAKRAPRSFIVAGAWEETGSTQGTVPPARGKRKKK